MPRMTEEQLLGILADIRERLEARDSMEGTISWCWTEEPGVYNVTGTYRVGNSEGQGGCVLLRDAVDDEPDEVPKPMDYIPGALT